MSNPDIISNSHACVAAVAEEAVIARRRCIVIFRTIGEAMLRRTLHRMVGCADPNLRSYRAKFSDCRVADHATRAEIGVVADLRIFDRGVAKDFAALAD